MRLISKFLMCLNVFMLSFSVAQIPKLVQFHYKIIDAPLLPYVKEYKGLLDANCKNKNYNLSDHYLIELSNDMKKDEWIGVCYRQLNGFHIQISQAWWNENTDTDDRRLLMFHELAHCLINQDHVNDTRNYMNPYLVSMPRSVYTKQAIGDIEKKCSQ